MSFVSIPSLFLLSILIAKSFGQSWTNIGWANMDLTLNVNAMVGQSCLNGTTLYTWNTYQKEYCSMITSSPLNGTWQSNATRYEFFPILISLPGEICDPKRAIYECAYGYRSCSAYRWIGFLQNEVCQMHEDWNPGLYWDSTLGTWQKIKDLGSVCKTSPECGRIAAWIYQSSADANGKCTEYFTLSDDTAIYAISEQDTFACKAGYAWLSSASGVYEYKVGADFQVGTYTWGKSVLSQNAGSEWTSSTDCKTSLSSVNAKCGCSYGSSITIWGILTGNVEWQSYFTSVQTYYKATKDCHNARNFDGIWTMNDLNNEKMCKKVTAKNYLYYTNAPAWVKLYSNKYLFPEVDEVEYWWDDERKYVLLGINSSSILNIWLATLLATTAIFYSMLY